MAKAPVILFIHCSQHLKSHQLITHTTKFIPHHRCESQVQKHLTAAHKIRIRSKLKSTAAICMLAN